ncbi:hypothetical protein HK100_012912 [Physocladia obscura]|uniref:HCP-like protein n=1 Tax=Physocladia obscura TaxID=109957 RepID=A0AAD5XC53_9FUNG|nr:hypothetical protein HK100_012912 [Physocladia obscura]
MEEPTFARQPLPQKSFSTTSSSSLNNTLLHLPNSAENFTKPILPQTTAGTLLHIPSLKKQQQNVPCVVKSPVKVGQVARILLDLCEAAVRIGEKLKDSGKLAKQLRSIHVNCDAEKTVYIKYKSWVNMPSFNDCYQESFISRKDDIKKHTATTVTTAQTTTQNSPPSNYHRLSLIQSSLYSMYMSAFALAQLLSTPSTAAPLSFMPVCFKRAKVWEALGEVEKSWQTLLMHLTLEIVKESNETVDTVTKNLHKLALATGAPDWEDLTLDDGRLLFAQGEKYVLGLGVAKNYELAFKSYMASAQCDNGDAMNMLGVMYETGMGREIDVGSAVKWFSQAAAKDCSEALNNLGRIHEQGKSGGGSGASDPSLASSFYLRAAELGNPDAMTSLGYLLELGHGKQRDPELAVQWYRLASAAGLARGMNCLAGCYYRGIGVAKDYGEACLWYRKAAELGNAHAQNNLGICYEEGKGIIKDLAMAKKWYKTASDAAKHPSATNNLGFMHLIEKNFAEALKLFHLAWALGSADAAYNIGILYETGCEDSEGILVEQNIDLAMRWYRDAADKDSTKAQIKIATLLTTLPNPRLHDAEIAKMYLTRACETGSAEAWNIKGQLQLLGIFGSVPAGEGMDVGLLVDEVGAYESFSFGAMQGHAESLYNLGICYEQGIGVEKDWEKGFMIFEEVGAARLGSTEAKQRVSLRERVKLGSKSGGVGRSLRELAQSRSQSQGHSQLFAQ